MTLSTFTDALTGEWVWYASLLLGISLILNFVVTVLS